VCGSPPLPNKAGPCEDDNLACFPLTILLLAIRTVECNELTLCRRMSRQPPPNVQPPPPEGASTLPTAAAANNTPNDVPVAAKPKKLVSLEEWGVRLQAAFDLDEPFEVSCAHCAEAALTGKGYISDEDLYELVEHGVVPPKEEDEEENVGGGDS
jgi:hypothetical protein